MAEVNTELLWTTNVTPAPTNMAMYPASHPNGYGRSVVIQKRTESMVLKTLSKCLLSLIAH